MIKRILGRTGFNVTAIGLGCFQCTGEFGISPEQADDLMDYALGTEINFFDTAAMYGFGESEAIIGRALRRHPDKKVYVSTKVGYLHNRGVTQMLGKEVYEMPTEIKRAIKHSLWLLQMDALDSIMIHEADMSYWGFNYETGDATIMTVLEELKKEGLVKNIGIGSWNYHKDAKLINTGRIDLALVPGGLTLLGRPMFKEIIPAAQKNNTGIVLGGGFGQNNPYLTSINRNGLPELLGSDKPERVAMGKKLEKIYDIAEELNVSMFELAIRYILAFEEVHTHVPGARETMHIKSNLVSAEKGPLDKAYVDAINDIQDKFASAADDKPMMLFGPPPGYIFDINSVELE
ncbi:MAG: aldo/keto reductase [Eubacteriales bacterium]|nr:aldo/keto reductase [Eubacteriales bacterium]